MNRQGTIGVDKVGFGRKTDILILVRNVRS